MGIKILDSIEVGNTGLNINNIILTIRGNFIIRKKIAPCEEIQADNTYLKTIYEIQTTVHYLINEFNSPIHIEEIVYSLDTVDNIDIFAEIYNRLKTRYTTPDGCIDV